MTKQSDYASLSGQGLQVVRLLASVSIGSASPYCDSSALETDEDTHAP